MHTNRKLKNDNKNYKQEVKTTFYTLPNNRFFSYSKAKSSKKSANNLCINYHTERTKCLLKINGLIITNLNEIHYSVKLYLKAYVTLKSTVRREAVTATLLDKLFQVLSSCFYIES